MVGIFTFQILSSTLYSQYIWDHFTPHVIIFANMGQCLANWLLNFITIKNSMLNKIVLSDNSTICTRVPTSSLYLEIDFGVFAFSSRIEHDTCMLFVQLYHHNG